MFWKKFFKKKTIRIIDLKKTIIENGLIPVRIIKEPKKKNKTIKFWPTQRVFTVIGGGSFCKQIVTFVLYCNLCKYVIYFKHNLSIGSTTR